MSRSATPPEQHQVTSTGWRVVGASAMSLLSAAAVADAAPSDDPDDVVFVAQFRVRPRTGNNAIDPLLASLDKFLSGVRTGVGVIARQTRLVDPPSRFHSIVWEAGAHSGPWRGELSWRRGHPAIGGIPLTDHLVLEETGADLRLTLRTFAPGGLPALRGHVGAGQARSPLLAAVAQAARLIFDNRVAESRQLSAESMDDFIEDVLLDEHRAFPVAVLSPTDAVTYYIDPAELSAELLGLAHVYFIDHPKSTFALTDGLGDRRLSCFFGALRVYQPGFSCGDDPLTHPLLMPDRLSDPVMRSGLAGSLALANTRRIPLVVPVAIAVAAPPAAGPAPALSSQSGTVADAAPPAPAADVAPAVVARPALEAGALQGLESAIRLLVDQLEQFRVVNAQLMDEIVRLRTTTSVRAANTANVDRRLNQLDRTIRDFINPPAPSAAPREEERASAEEASDVSLTSVVEQAMAAQADALLILETAVQSAAESPYEDVDRVAVILDAMAYIARRRQADAIGQSLRDAFRGFGIDYRGGIARGTSARQKQQYIAHLPSGDVLCEEHIALGSGYDPRHCLRIYFSSRAPGEPRFVIAHVGRHFDVATTT